MSKLAPKLPQFALIKQYLQAQIATGDWPAGTKTPSENELATMFNVSRMTARRALQELADAKALVRKPGHGSFVAEQKPEIAQLELYNRLQRAQTMGTYSNRIISLQSIVISDKIRRLLHSDSAETIYQLTMVHLEKQRPVQWQQLHVNPLLAPALLKQKFNKVSADDYLHWVAPATSVEHQLVAVAANAAQRRELWLAEPQSDTCMQLVERRWVKQQVLSFSVSLLPAHQYRLGVQLLSEIDTR